MTDPTRPGDQPEQPPTVVEPPAPPPPLDQVADDLLDVPFSRRIDVERGTEIRILNGKFSAYGQSLLIREGRLIYNNNPIDNPELRITAVREVGDVTAGINVTGLYQFPYDISVGASFVGRQGYPAVYRDEVTTDATPLGFNDVILNDIGDERFPNVYEFDLRLAKDFRIANAVGVTLAADLFNVPNQRTVLQRDTLIFFDGEPSGSGNELTELQSPRVWRFSARITY